MMSTFVSHRMSTPRPYPCHPNHPLPPRCLLPHSPHRIRKVPVSVVALRLRRALTSIARPSLLGSVAVPLSVPAQHLIHSVTYAIRIPPPLARAEAKSNRKIEDLEITNRSLLAINATLEASKHKQANEIRELRRKLRESRLVLPPRAFRAIKSSLGPEDVADDEDIEDDDNENDNDEDGDEHDEIYGRVKHILEDLLEMGRRALRAEPGDFGKQGSSVKVLSAEEVRSWRGDMGDDVSSMHSTHTDAESDGETGLQRQPPTPSQITIPGDDESRPEGEGEGEAMMDGGEHNAGILPPITVTFS
ncbi:hypothetical protein B0F90DRAFT_95886 [Multifurca ochricompacta]|uniref:Uncharacterized protein n=1 Tax=Multifurca ochricompacta TaxID=376703 RepID=A0AAD4QQG8_9AGAM|nr:hypothetical protein B0F90DRAFT_95886 [Multifurca ochricompacta]